MSASIDMRTGVEEQIREKDREFERNVAARDASRLCTDLYAEDARLLPPNAPVIEGRANIEGFWRGLLDAGLTDVALETTEIRQLGDTAYAVGTYRLAIRPQEGEIVQDRGKYVYIYRRWPDGTWKAILDIFNSDVPAA